MIMFSINVRILIQLHILLSLTHDFRRNVETINNFALCYNLNIVIHVAIFALHLDVHFAWHHKNYVKQSVR